MTEAQKQAIRDNEAVRVTCINARELLLSIREKVPAKGKLREIWFAALTDIGCLITNAVIEQLPRSK